MGEWGHVRQVGLLLVLVGLVTGVCFYAVFDVRAGGMRMLMLVLLFCICVWCLVCMLQIAGKQRGICFGELQSA